MLTAVISIGNSDDKLTQKQWSDFMQDVSWIIKRYDLLIHLNGFSSPTAPWQNACWIIQLADEPEFLDKFRSELTRLADEYAQDSIALLIGETEFVSGTVKYGSQ